MIFLCLLSSSSRRRSLPNEWLCRTPTNREHSKRQVNAVPNIGHYIGDKIVGREETGAIAVVNPSTETPIAFVADGRDGHVDAAVSAARQALPQWSSTPIKRRAAILGTMADRLAARHTEIASLITSELGAPVKTCVGGQVDMPIAILRDIANRVQDFEFVRQIGNSAVFMEPVGIVGAITPWNFPFYQTIAKIAPALAMGCTVALKPSELTPLAIPILMDAADQAGLPAGVLNVVHGSGAVVGEAMVHHPGIDKISFTGSTDVGKQVAARAALSVKRLALELGGKSAALVLSDAPLEQAVTATVASCMYNSGQTCSATTRLLIPRTLSDRATEIASAAAAELSVGDPTCPEVDLGPLVNARQRSIVRNFIINGERDGARLVLGGALAPDGLDRGYYMMPTIFAKVSPSATIARQEIFGPVLSIIEYSSEEEAVFIANDTIYGLAGTVWSGDPQRAVSIARMLRAGRVDINDAKFNISAPTGGFKQSGYGRELGPFSLMQFAEQQSIQQ